MADPGYIEEKTAIRKRLARIEGQVRGIQRMVDEDRYCIEVLDQINASTRALQSVGLVLLEDHLSHCVARAVSVGGRDADEKLAEASEAIARMVRS